MKRTLLFVTFWLGISTGCATHYTAPTNKPVKNLSSFQTNSATARIGSECLQIVTFQNGRNVRLKLDAQICKDAEAAQAIETTVRRSLPAPEAPPTK